MRRRHMCKSSPLGSLCSSSSSTLLHVGLLHDADDLLHLHLALHHVVRAAVHRPAGVALRHNLVQLARVRLRHHLRLLGLEPPVPLVRDALPLRRKVRVLLVADGVVQLLEALGVLLDVLGHLRLLLGGEQRGRARPPQELVEPLLPVLIQQLAVEGPHVEAVLHLVHGGHGGGHVAPRGVPLHVRRHEVLRRGHGLHLVHVEELELAVHGLEPRQHHHLALRRPEQVVRRLVLDGADQLHLVDGAVLVDHGVEGHVGARAVAVDHGEAVPLGLPRERHDLLVLVRQLQHLHGAVGLLDAEQLEAAVRALLGLRVPVHLHCKVVSALLPKHAHVADAEQVLGADLLLGGHGDERHARRLVAAALLRLEHRKDGVRRRPAEVHHAVQLQALLVHHLHVRGVVHRDGVLAHAREEGALGARAGPLEHGPGEAAARPRRARRKVRDGALELAQLGAAAHVEEVHHHGRSFTGVRGIVCGAGGQVPLAGRELDELHSVVRHLLEALEGGAAPQRHALAMHGGHVVAAGRPLHVRLGPERPLVHLHRLLHLRVVPVDLRLVPEADGELVTPAVVQHPALRVLLGGVRLGLRPLVCVRDSVVLGEVVEHGHLEDVRLVELVALRLLLSRRRLPGGLELNKREPLGGAGGIHGHVQPALADGSDLPKDLLEHRGQLVVLLLGHRGQVVHDDDAAEAALGLGLLHVDALVVAEDAHVFARGDHHVLDVHLLPVDVPILSAGEVGGDLVYHGGRGGGAGATGVDACLRRRGRGRLGGDTR
mmetsp:Transcript_6031/g.15378  ORF Transcript_6031/g.15378 Transcript_6031/m.15378 type:complete len:771 (+) Transcript_6031:499-2811(+)